MADRFDTATEAIAGADRGQLVWKVELLDPDGRLLATTDPAEAVGEAIHWEVRSDPARIQSDRIAQRSSAVRVASSSGSLVPTSKNSLLHPDTDPRVRVWAGVRQSSGDTWWPQSTMAIRVTSADDSSGLASVAVALTDAVDPVRSSLVTAFRFDAGEPVEDVVERLLLQIIDPGRFRLPVTGRTVLAGDAEVGDDRYGLINSLLEACAYELVADPYGLLVARPIPPSADDPQSRRWKYGGPGNISVHSASMQWSSSTARAWKVEGGSPLDGRPGPTLTVFDLDPASQGYFRGLGYPVVVDSRRYPFASSIGQLQEAGYGQFRRHGVGPGVVAFRTVPNPALRQGDLVDLTIPSLGLDEAPARVLGLELPVHNEQLMTVSARLAWAPDAGYVVPGVDLADDRTATFYDDFDRSDEDLQVLPGADNGSPLWTEIGYSWGVEGGVAVQRYGGSQGAPNPPWSLAFINQAMQTSDHYAELTIQRLPAGRRVGPVVRSNGTMAGYAALVSNGELSLEVWLNGRSQAVLGTWALTASPLGLTVRLDAVGTSLAVTVNGTTVLSRSDDRMTGSFVGMLAYGGFAADAPAVRPFAAGLAS